MTIASEKLNYINFIICGLEHSGTTLLSDLMRQLPSCDSGFECGVLLSETPAQFLDLEPYSSNLLKGWEITSQDLKICTKQPSFNSFYKELYSRSSLFENNSVPSIRFDKTPRYITQIEKVVKRAAATPILAILKDPRAILWSDFKRSGKKIEEISSWYDNWLPQKKRYMELAYSGYEYCLNSSQQCLLVRLEDLCFSAKETIYKIDNFLNLEYTPLQFYFKTKRYAHTKGCSINISTVVEHIALLPAKISQDVAKELGDFKYWFYDF